MRWPFVTRRRYERDLANLLELERKCARIALAQSYHRVVVPAANRDLTEYARHLPSCPRADYRLIAYPQPVFLGCDCGLTP